MTAEKKFFDTCISHAHKAIGVGELPVAAAIVKKNTIIAIEHNQSKSENNPCAHAELLAITSACKHLKTDHLYECDLYCTLEPCLMCYQAAKIARIRHIYFIHPDYKFGVFTNYHHLDLLRSHGHQLSATGPFKEYDTDNMLSSYFKKKR